MTKPVVVTQQRWAHIRKSQKGRRDFVPMRGREFRWAWVEQRNRGYGVRTSLFLIHGGMPIHVIDKKTSAVDGLTYNLDGLHYPDLKSVMHFIRGLHGERTLLKLAGVD